MTLFAGARLGSYEIVAPLGAGGMGEVYRARDPRLGRDVAIKVGPGGKWQVSTAGGAMPTWSRTRRDLLYRADDGRIMVVPYTVEGDSFGAEKPRAGSPGPPLPVRPSFRTFDLHPDGERVAVRIAPGNEPEGGRDHVTLIFNFFEELGRVAPAAKP